jgi:hypothetical protein
MGARTQARIGKRKPGMTLTRLKAARKLSSNNDAVHYIAQAKGSKRSKWCRARLQESASFLEKTSTKLLTLERRRLKQT